MPDAEEAVREESNTNSDVDPEGCACAWRAAKRSDSATYAGRNHAVRPGSNSHKVDARRRAAENARKQHE